MQALVPESSPPTCTPLLTGEAKEPEHIAATVKGVVWASSSFILSIHFFKTSVQLASQQHTLI